MNGQVCGHRYLPAANARTEILPGKSGAVIDHAIIPVVVHVVHNGEDDFPAPNDSISYEQVASEFPTLDKNFRCIPGTTGKGAGADTRIEFQLACKDPNGLATTGVVYHALPDEVSITVGTDNFQHLDWDRNKYYNVYIVHKITGPDGNESVAGYASALRAVIEYRYWGTVGLAASALNVTGTHELGHALSLLHPFNFGCNASNDLVDDTPAQGRDTPKTDASRENSCEGVEQPDRPDPHNNYMDYLNEQFTDTFTPGQRQRLWNSASTQHAGKWTDNNMQATGTGKYRKSTAIFFAEQQNTCAGSTLRLTDYSLSWPTTYQWTITGGSPTVTLTSAEADPNIVLPNPGSYTVKLVVSNLSGESDTLERVGYLQANLQTRALPFTEEFEGSTFPPAGWQVINPDAGKMQQQTFRQSPFGGAGGSANSVTLDAFDYHRIDQLDHLLLPPVQYTAEKTYLELAVDMAYAPNSTFMNEAPYLYRDSLMVYASTDCGNSWQMVSSLGSRHLETTAPRQTRLGPSVPSHAWQTRYFYLEPGSAQAVVWKFTWKNGYGNNIYLDNVKVQEVSEQQTVSRTTADRQHPPSLYLYPNPTADELTLRGLAARTQVQVLNGAGQLVHTFTTAQPGFHRVHLAPLHLAPGIYRIVASSPEGIHTATFNYLPR
ncbi:MAG: PKD domain-containing protein [Bacteroidetes bacterium]|nr:PKD domain-containing protein [Bacteroidota bacterium]